MGAINNHLIRYIEDIPADQNIGIFGAGFCGEELIGLIFEKRPDLSVKCFIDSYKTGSVFGKKILDPSQLHTLDGQIDMIVICSREERFCSDIAKVIKKECKIKFCYIHPLFGQQPVCEEKNFYAIYDLEVAPPTFDILAFLCMAEIQRVVTDCQSLHIVIISPKHDRYGSKHIVQWRIRNLLVPLCWLMPSCKGVTVTESRSDVQSILIVCKKNKFPQDYCVENPTKCYNYASLSEMATFEKLFPALESPEMGNELIVDWIKKNFLTGKKIISITLRGYSLDEARNSNVNEWIKFAKTLDTDIYEPIFICDTFSSFHPIPKCLDEFIIFNEAPWNIELRMAFYENCFLNMFVGSGPAMLCVLNKLTRYLIFFNLECEDVLVTTKEHVENEAISVGSQFENSSPTRKVIWKEDKYENIVNSFNECVL